MRKVKVKMKAIVVVVRFRLLVCQRIVVVVAPSRAGRV